MGCALAQPKQPPAADPFLFPPGGLAGLYNNPTYETLFSTFSDFRLFTPVGSNITEASFFVPGTYGDIPAWVPRLRYSLVRPQRVRYDGDCL